LFAWRVCFLIHRCRFCPVPQENARHSSVLENFWSSCLAGQVLFPTADIWSQLLSRDGILKLALYVAVFFSFNSCCEKRESELYTNRSGCHLQRIVTLQVCSRGRFSSPQKKLHCFSLFCDSKFAIAIWSWKTLSLMGALHLDSRSVTLATQRFLPLWHCHFVEDLYCFSSILLCSVGLSVCIVGRIMKEELDIWMLLLLSLWCISGCSHHCCIPSQNLQ
jgi:hypothetical protein